MKMEEFTKYFTVDEANALIPKLEAYLVQIQICYVRAKEILGPIEALSLSSAQTEMRLREHPELRTLFEEIQRNVTLIQQTGALFKGVELGLVDFPWRRDGETALLCWQHGEKEIRWWHPIDSGFTGRRPLPGGLPRSHLN